MEWLSMIVAGVMLVLVAAPAVLLLGTVFVLVPMALLAPPPPMVARTSFDCPFSGQKVNVAFLASPRAEHPADVVSCSMFTDGVRCKKGCLAMAESAWAPSPMVPRFALLSGGEALR